MRKGANKTTTTTAFLFKGGCLPQLIVGLGKPVHGPWHSRYFALPSKGLVLAKHQFFALGAGALSEEIQKRGAKSSTSTSTIQLKRGIREVNLALKLLMFFYYCSIIKMSPHRSARCASCSAASKKTLLRRISTAHSIINCPLSPLDNIYSM